MTIYLGADHRGFALKEVFKRTLTEQGMSVVDVGAEKIDPLDDYPDYAALVGQKVQENPQDKGIVFCSNGVGVNIVANKIKGVRSVLGFSVQQVTAARSDDNCNVLALPAEYISEEEAKAIVNTFLQTEFKSEEKYQRRIDKISHIEQTQ